MAGNVKIRVFVPTCEDQRNKVLEDAIKAAEQNMGITLEVWPIDVCATMAILSSNNASHIIAKLIENGYNPHETSIFFVRKDIHTDSTNWCFGATVDQTIVISDYKVWHSTTNYATKTAMLLFLIEHELGHVYGAADDVRASGIYDKHCKDDKCVMRQVTSVDELADFAKQLIVKRKDNGCYCKHCQKRFDLFYGRA